MAFCARWFVAVGILVVAAFSPVVTPSALAQEPDPPGTEMTITPVDDDDYLPADDVTALHELDAIRRHVSDLKALVLFGTGFIGICVLCQKLF